MNNPENGSMKLDWALKMEKLKATNKTKYEKI